MYAHICGQPQHPVEGMGSPEARATGGYELSNVHAENWTWVLCENQDF